MTLKFKSKIVLDIIMFILMASSAKPSETLRLLYACRVKPNSPHRVPKQIPARSWNESEVVYKYCFFFLLKMIDRSQKNVYIIF